MRRGQKGTKRLSGPFAYSIHYESGSNCNSCLHIRVDFAMVVICSRGVKRQGKCLALSNITGRVERAGGAGITCHRMRCIATIDPDHHCSCRDGQRIRLKEIVAWRAFQHLYNYHIGWLRSRWRRWRWLNSRCRWLSRRRTGGCRASTGDQNKNRNHRHTQADPQPAPSPSKP
jgi:hypothetical protein